MSESDPDAVVVEVVAQDGSHRGWCVHCPACDLAHHFDDRWSFNGDHVKPTFRASMLVTRDYGDPPVHQRCHSFLTDGVWEYCGDSNHAHAGQRLPAPAWLSRHSKDYGGVRL